ncbi:MAG: AbrB/MazE/SpoVT family DNA-binding domain-containing protein [Spirosomaceae bacterium]|jgi:antitoxin MazE|nr:AbrB/MazE/SpoVT family DNA-binding domain-containing protein [Spirosomataceae bacterium]
MKTRLVKIGNSQGILISKTFLEQYQFGAEVELKAEADGLLIKPLSKLPRQDWESRFQAAFAANEKPENALLEGFSNDFETNDDWTW